MKTQTSSSKFTFQNIKNPTIKPKNFPSCNTTKNSIASLVEKVRIRNYVNLYSSSSFKPATRASEKSEHEGDNLSNIVQPNKSTIKVKNLSDTVSKPIESIQTLRRKCNEILYEIQKAQSDKLELMRDISTYEYEFSKAADSLSKISEINSLILEIPEVSYESDDIEQTLESGLKDFLTQNDFKTSFLPISENFDLKPQAYSKTKSNLLNSSMKISEIPCIVHVFGTKWLEELEVSIFTLKSQSFKKSIKHSIISLYSTKQELHSILHTEVLSKFYIVFYSSHRTFILMHHPDHGDRFKVIYYFIRGYGNCSLSLTIKQDTLNIEVIDHRVLLEVPSEILRAKTLKELDILLVKSLIKDYIYFDAYSKTFYWQEGKEIESIFQTKETFSNLLKDEYLKDVLSMKSFKILFSFSLELEGLDFTFEFHSFKTQSKIVIFSDRESVEVPQESRYFKLLNDLQYMNLSTSQVTLKNSLEVRVLIKKQFPRLFIHKQNPNT